MSMQDGRTGMCALEDDIRQRINVFLPEALRVAMNAYQAFCVRQEKDVENTSYKQNQEALKAGIGHIALLVKLGRACSGGAAPPGDGGSEAAVLEGLIAAAEAEMARYAGHNKKV